MGSYLLLRRPIYGRVIWVAYPSGSNVNMFYITITIPLNVLDRDMLLFDFLGGKIRCF
jgi:hypothetical protein